MILAIFVGICGLFIGAVIQWLNMRNKFRKLKEDAEFNKFQFARTSIIELKELFKELFVEASNMSHDVEHSDEFREHQLIVSETWKGAVDAARYKLADIEEKEYDSLCS